MSTLRTVCGATKVWGVDVSKWQETIDWRRVAKAGAQFAFIRVSDGTNYLDSKFLENWNGAAEAGLFRGAYQFFRPGQDAVAQAEICLERTRGEGELPLCIDVEASDGRSPTEVATSVRRWVDRVTRPTLGRPRAPVVYASPAFWKEQVASAHPGAACPLWVAHWGVSCPWVPLPWSDWLFWQHSAEGVVDGISTKVDLNWFNGSRTDLRLFAGAGGLSFAAGAGLALGAAFVGKTLL